MAMEPRRVRSGARIEHRRSSSEPVEESRPLALTAADGVALSALAYGPPAAPVAVVFGHGFTGTQRNRKVVELARALAARGLGVYTTDFRGHGASSGRSTLGEHEVLDLEAVVAVARSQHERVVTVGASMGAFVALRHVGLGGKVDGVVAISSPVFRTIPRMPRARVLGRLVHSERGRRLLARHGTRVDPYARVSAAPIELAAAIAPTPVAIVHGGRDRYVPLSDARALHERLGSPRRLVILPDFGHGEAGFSRDFAGVLERLIEELLGGFAVPDDDPPRDP
jgi:pimeloyl-ACP methyl ester carboxylesterase